MYDNVKDLDAFLNGKKQKQEYHRISQTFRRIAFDHTILT